MRWKKSFLVVANITAMSDELLAALEAHAAAGPARFTLIVPAGSPRGERAAAETLLEATERMLAARLEVHGEVALGEPIVAVSEEWDPRRYDEIIISTLPMRISKWLHAGLPERIGELTGAPVTHVVSRPRPPRSESVRTGLPQRNPMGPLSVLGWVAPRAPVVLVVVPVRLRRDHGFAVDSRVSAGRLSSWQIPPPLTGASE